jgi:hypothetical protein
VTGTIAAASPTPARLVVEPARMAAATAANTNEVWFFIFEFSPCIIGLKFFTHVNVFTERFFARGLLLHFQDIRSLSLLPPLAFFFSQPT